MLAQSVPYGILLNEQNEDLDELKAKIKDMSEQYNEIDDEKITVKMNVTKKQDENGNIYCVVGKEDKNIIITNLNDINHLEVSEEREIGDSWDVWFDAQYFSPGGNKYRVQTRVIYEDDGFDPEKDGWAAGNGVVNAAKGAVELVFSVLGGIKDFVGNLTKNFWGTIFTLLLDGVKFLADIFQMVIANSFQTLTNGTFTDFTITYSKDFLEKDGSGNTNDTGAGKRDAYTKVSAYKKSEASNVKNIDGKSLGFDKDTPIPVVPGDLYYIALGKIDFFDINILSTSNTSSVWTYIRNVASVFIHVTIYIATAFLLISLIIRGFQIISHAYTTPEQRVEIMKGIKNFALAVVMLMGTVLIMALAIYGTNAISEAIAVKSDLEGPIRVNVKEAKYSFSTTITGYYRYMCEIEDVNKSPQKALYTFCYVGVVIVNCVVAIAMFIRLFGIILLSIAGPIIAVSSPFNVVFKFRYTEWIIAYFLIALMQNVFGGFYLLILKCFT